MVFYNAPMGNIMKVLNIFNIIKLIIEMSSICKF